MQYEGINRVHLEARVVEEAELRRVGNTPLCNLRVGTRGQGRFLYITVVLRDSDAIEASGLVEGEWVELDGKLRSREWRGRDGKVRREIELDPCHLLGAGRPPGADQEGTRTTKRSLRAQRQAPGET